MAKTKKTKKQIKIAQANMQADALTSDGIQYTGSDDFSYSFADLDEDWASDNMQGGVTTSYTVDGISFDYDDKELRKKYPALQDAWEHYKNIKHMCEQKEKEDEV